MRTRRAGVVAVLLALVVSLAAGCAGDGGGGQRIGAADERGSSVPISDARVSADGRDVTVTGGTSSPCATVSLAVTEEADQVGLRLTEHPSSEVCIQTVGGSGVATATLDEPVGTRTLVDVSNGKRVSYFDGQDLATVDHLPTGYELTSEYLDEARTPRPDGTSPLAWVRVYGDGSGESPNIEVAQSQPGGPAVVDIPRTGTTTVGGTRAGVHRASGRLALTWTAGTYRIAVMSYSNGMTPTHTRAELLAVAGGVRLP